MQKSKCSPQRGAKPNWGHEHSLPALASIKLPCWQKAFPTTAAPGQLQVWMFLFCSVWATFWVSAAWFGSGTKPAECNP